ncbi:MAG TPA: NERD domain-containing protein [Pseudoneobacillus sp.]|nr:NERD domain-containing protein [Pseudoneobacillus sp.]
MIVKKILVSLKILALKALLRRIPLNHPKRHLIQDELNRRLAGFKGELAVYYHLEELPDESFHIFHGIRLKSGNHYFQIDFLLISTYFILIVETKNYTGTVKFHTKSEQLLRDKNGIETALPNPLPQVNRHKILLRKWLREHKFPDLPIEALIVFSNPSTIIQADDQRVFRVVCPVTSLHQRIKETVQYHQSEKITVKEQKKLSKTILKNHIEDFPNLLGQYQISPSEINPGAQCPKCLKLPLLYSRGKWYCSHCQKQYKNLLQQAIQDYGLLINQTITNKDARTFLQINSPDIVTKLLHSLNLPSVGTTKSKIYLLYRNKIE